MIESLKKAQPNAKLYDETVKGDVNGFILMLLLLTLHK